MRRRPRTSHVPERPTHRRTPGAFANIAAAAALASLVVAPTPRHADAQERSDTPLRVFISVDMEGIGGVGTPAMASSSGKDYATARRLMTDEVNAVVDAVLGREPGADIVVNDSHGDHQNVLHTELHPDVTYIQGSIKPLGMVQGLDGSFDAAIFIGYHARAETPGGFLAHTGSGIVRGLWLNGTEVGEGGLNAAFAGFHGVPVILASGDAVFAEQFGGLTGSRTVTTKVAETAQSARMVHPGKVLGMLGAATEEALDGLAGFRPLPLTPAGEPVRVRMRFDREIHAEILESVPGVRRIDGTTVEATATDMDEAYRLVRLMYRFVRV